MPRGRRFIGWPMPSDHVTAAAHRLHRRLPAPQTGEPAFILPAIIIGGGNGNGVAAGDPVHPGHGRADGSRRAADQVPGRHQRRGRLHLRPALRVRLLRGARRHHGLLHDRRGGDAAVGGRQRQVRQREARRRGGQVRHAHAPGLGPVHALHGAILPGQRPPVPQEVKTHVPFKCSSSALLFLSFSFTFSHLCVAVLICNNCLLLLVKRVRLIH